ncbi:FAD-binding oxidoreductase [Kibdelosporangium aridum]|uniref:FAD/FMN-containing dehydrogenase n=1 Tax=Kibdelosporangium aridum TaxID=2030 RepID=A0A1Y5XQS4_KIBAR|nr:FAD-binding oxidoreductase [Kibdelosporangium aridum]SMD09195.1 FAD/FMN-containing dehydrogenase [Kibdelosporangium aridum]
MTVSRRDLLVGLGAAMTGFGMAAPPDWDRLRRRLAGPLYLPQDAGYAAARQGYFTIHDGQRPAAVARCTRIEDVQACVEFAAATRTPVSARSGGHSYAGYSTRDGSLVVDLRQLAGIQLYPDGTAVIGAGAQLIDVYATLAQAGRLLPGGTCPSVGIAGLTLGGGIGVTARKYGLTCDRLVSAQIVTADSRLRTVSAVQEPELFWALRGGGGGNFGIVTSFTFQTAPATDLTVFALEFPAAALPALLGGWQSWPVPDEVWSNVSVPGDPQATTWVDGCFVGSSSGVQPHLDKLTRLVGTQPLARIVKQFSYFDAMRYFAGCSELSLKECRPNWTSDAGLLDRGAYVATSRMIGAPLRDPAATAALLRSSPGLTTQFDSFGGEIARGPDTAFPYRQSIASMQVTHEFDGTARQAIAHVRDETAREFGQTGYINYIDPHMPNWAQAYYGSNLAKLRTIARRYDPGRVFAFAQGLS